MKFINSQSIKRILLLFIIIIFSYFCIYTFSGNTKKITNISDNEKIKILNVYNVTISNEIEIDSFEYRSFFGKYTYVLVLNNVDDIEKFLNDNNDIINKVDNLNRKKMYISKNQKYFPYEIQLDKLYCNYDNNNKIYLSAYGVGINYNKNIENLFWQLYNE